MVCRVGMCLARGGYLIIAVEFLILIPSDLGQVCQIKLGIEANPLLSDVAADNQQGIVQTVVLEEMMNCSAFTEAAGTVTFRFPIAMKGIKRCILKLHTSCLEPLTKLGAVRNGSEGFDAVDVKLS